MSTLEAFDVEVSDRRRRLLEPTSLSVSTGDVLVVHGDPGPGHTLLALALAGRLVPDAGLVRMDHDPTAERLQEGVALVDVPDVSAPDDVLPLVTVAGEELAMADEPARPGQVREWLVQHGFGEQVGQRMEDLTPWRRVRVLALLAARRPGVRFLVLAQPDRFGELDESWLTGARDLAGAGFGIVLLVSTGTARRIGAAHPDVPQRAFGEARVSAGGVR